MHLLAILAAAPVVAQVPPPQAADPLTPLYYLIGGQTVLMLLGMGGIFIRWLATRMVEREDKDKEDLREQLAAHEEKFQKLERTLYDLDRLLGRVESDGKLHHSGVEAIRGTIAEIKGQIETRFSGQADFYRGQLKEVVSTVTEKLEKLEFQIRQDTTRAIHDAAAMRARQEKG